MKNLLSIFVLLLSLGAAAEARDAKGNSGNYILEQGDGAKADVVIYFHEPANLTPDSPVLLVIPGSGRNAWDYRDGWINASEKYGVLILSPHYPEKGYPMFWDYNIGGMLSDVVINAARTGFASFSINQNPQDWIFRDFDTVFDGATRRFGVNARQYDMFGHSAGGQILHRFTMFNPNNKASRLLAANAGWYTVPQFGIGFPYGLEDSGVSKDTLRSAFKTGLVVFLGELDNENEKRGHLARNQDLDVQGTHRFARGKHFFAQAEEMAGQLGVEFNWTLKVVPGVGHDYRRMSEAAAEFLYGTEAKIPH